MSRIGIFIPVYNAGIRGLELATAIQNQTTYISRFLIFDSYSTDESVSNFNQHGAEIHRVPQEEFDHAGTRHSGAAALGDCDILVFLTQDSIPADSEVITNLISCFDDVKVGAAFGRQIPRPKANPIETHARYFNYPAANCIKTAEDIRYFGLKTAFISNSFAAYRRSALEAIGGFPNRCIVSEDTFVAAKMILSGWKIAYNAEACVYHSHNYNCRQEFQRYFDIGVFHAREPWIREEFGGAEGEGKRFLNSEMKYLLKHAPYLIPSALVRTVFKYTGFRMGLLERYLPIWIKKHLSQQKAFWIQEKNG